METVYKCLYRDLPGGRDKVEDDAIQTNRVLSFTLLLSTDLTGEGSKQDKHTNTQETRIQIDDALSLILIGNKTIT